MFKKIKQFFFPQKPLILKDEINLKDLNKKSKAELEKLGRKLGIELDKRLTKAKLITQIKKVIRVFYLHFIITILSLYNYLSDHHKVAGHTII